MENESLEKFTPRAQTVLSLAEKEADEANHPMITPEYLLLGILREGKCSAAKILKKFGLEYIALRPVVQSLVGIGPSNDKISFPAVFSKKSQAMLALAERQTEESGAKKIDTENILYFIITTEDGGVIEKSFKRLGLDIKVLFIILNKKMSSKIDKAQMDYVLS